MLKITILDEIDQNYNSAFVVPGNGRTAEGLGRGSRADHGFRGFELWGSTLLNPTGTDRAGGILQGSG